MDVVDPKPALEKECHAPCAAFWKAYLDCAERVKVSTAPDAQCSPQYFEYYTCVDKCVAPKLFAKLK